jgi:hypothetical protein
VAAEREYTRFDFAAASLFLVTPEAWLELERKVFPRKTVALNSELEAVHKYKPMTLDVEWAAFRLAYVGQQYVIPEMHPIYRIIHH